MRRLGTKESFIQQQMNRFDQGELTPTDVTYEVDYEATAPSAITVQKRSVCIIRINRPTDRLIMETVVVDGLRLWQYQAQNR